MVCATAEVPPRCIPTMRTHEDRRVERSSPVEGSAAIHDETLGTWDFIRVAGSGAHDAIAFPNGATLLAATLR